MTAPSSPASAPSSDLVRRVRRQALGDLPHRTASRVPDKLALVGGGRRFTYAELAAVVDAGVADAGLAKGDRLALLSHNCWEFVALSFAAARIGVVLVPVNFMLSAPEIAFILDHSGAAAFVVEDALVPVAA
ncbi:AMP-binding protein, partial [Nostocoides japonicum]|uniref:AMP-binding protein n=1 Tax=Nostocoides japonicum TaxID=99481 RepID=UPI00065BF7FC